MKGHRDGICLSAGLVALGMIAGYARAQAVRAPAPVVQSAAHQFDSGDYSGAISSLRQYLSQAGNDAEGQFWIGRCFYELQDFTEAITAFERAVQLDSQNSGYHEWLGRAYGMRALQEHSFFLARRVKKEFEEAVRLDPKNAPAHRDLEEYCIEAPWIIGGSTDEAREQADEIRSIDAVQGHLALAEFYDKSLKKPDLAENEYRLILEGDPKRIDAYLESANFFINQKKPDKAQPFIDAAAAQSATDPRLSYYRGVQLVLRNRESAEAEQYLKSYLASTPSRSEWPAHAAAREWLGKLYEAEGRRPQAAEQYRAALQLDPERRDAKAGLERLQKASN
jgi:tetratricopeptide (TPR) repeat protein